MHPLQRAYVLSPLVHEVACSFFCAARRQCVLIHLPRHSKRRSLTHYLRASPRRLKLVGLEVTTAARGDSSGLTVWACPWLAQPRFLLWRPWLPLHRPGPRPRLGRPRLPLRRPWLAVHSQSFSRGARAAPAEEALGLLCRHFFIAFIAFIAFPPFRERMAL